MYPVARGRWLLALAACAGCDRVFAIDKVEPRPDAAGVDAAFAPCIGTGLVQVCVEAEIPRELKISGSTTLPLNTDTAVECMAYTFAANDPNACVVAAEDVVIAGTMSATGTRSLVIIGLRAVTIEGVVDVSSRLGSFGAGASGPCGIPAATFGGGAGGSFGGPGGDGGGSSFGNGGGIAGPPVVPDRLRGGCSGGAGNGQTNVPRSRGGGAVYILSHVQIAIDGTINASGMGGLAGGFSGPSGDGGDGGGSGGLIGLEAPLVTTTASSAVFANGGGGGQGAGSEMSEPGCSGTDPSEPTVPAEGGGPTVMPSCNHRGGAGGAGSAGSSVVGVGGTMAVAPGGGGGGGGGGAGVIIVVPPQPLTNASPAPS